MRDLNVRTNLIAVGDKPAKLAKLNVTDNGTYTPTYPIEGYDEVEVEVPEPVLDEARFTENGTYTPEHDGFSEVTVEVPEPAPVILESLTATENGTYDPADYMADGFSDVTVNVPSGGSGSADFYLIDQGIISTPSSVTDSSSGRLSKISPYAILWQETYNNFDYVNVNDEYFSRIHGSNSSRTFYTKIPKTAKRIEISGYNNQQSSYTYLTFYILAGPDPSPSGMYGGQYNCNILEDFHAAQYSGWSTEQLNSQLYFTRTGSGPKKIDDQVLIIDVEGMYQAGIITDDFWLACSCCDIEFYCRYIKVVMPNTPEPVVSKPLSFKIDTNGGSFNNDGTWVYQNRYVYNFSSSSPYYPLRNDGGWPSYDKTLPLKIHLRFKCKNPYTVSHTMAILGHTYDFYYGPAIEIRTDGSIWCGFSTNGGSWQYDLYFDVDASRASKFQSDWNTIDYEYGGSGNKVWTVTYTDPNGVTEVRTTNVSDNPYLYTGYGSTCLGGCNHSANHTAKDAILDLYDCYWKENGNIIWGYEL